MKELHYEPMEEELLGSFSLVQFVIIKPPSYCFEETMGFDVKVSFASRPESRLIRWYNEPADTFW